MSKKARHKKLHIGNCKFDYSPCKIVRIEYGSNLMQRVAITSSGERIKLSPMAPYPEEIKPEPKKVIPIPITHF